MDVLNLTFQEISFGIHCLEGFFFGMNVAYVTWMVAYDSRSTFFMRDSMLI